MEQPDIITADQLITEIIECAKRIRRQLGPGFLEKGLQKRNGRGTAKAKTQL